MTSAESLSPTPQAPEAPARTGWGWIFAYGVLVMIVGFLALINPLATGVATGLLLSFILLFYGVMAIISGLTALSSRGRWVEIALGGLALLIGILLFFSPLTGALSLVWAMGFWLLLSGIFQIVGAIRIALDRWWRLFLGVVDVVLGGILLFAGPVPSLGFLALIVGISFLFKGLFLLMLALGMKRVSAFLAG